MCRVFTFTMIVAIRTPGIQNTTSSVQTTLAMSQIAPSSASSHQAAQRQPRPLRPSRQQSTTHVAGTTHTGRRRTASDRTPPDGDAQHVDDVPDAVARAPRSRGKKSKLKNKHKGKAAESDEDIEGTPPSKRQRRNDRNATYGVEDNRQLFGTIPLSDDWSLPPPPSDIRSVAAPSVHSSMGMPPVHPSSSISQLARSSLLPLSSDPPTTSVVGHGRGHRSAYNIGDAEHTTVFLKASRIVERWMLLNKPFLLEEEFFQVATATPNVVSTTSDIVSWPQRAGPRPKGRQT